MNEVIEITPVLQQMVADGEIGNLAKVQAELKQQGLFNLRQDGVIKALRAITTIEEVWSATNE
jgi:type II secretory ATPase GspE/PulE/Tfp pilus assembly ATPase PilB-like protein